MKTVIDKESHLIICCCFWKEVFVKNIKKGGLLSQYCRCADDALKEFDIRFPNKNKEVVGEQYDYGK